MKLKDYQWLDDHLVGGVKIECDCGNVFGRETLDGDGSNTIIACPKCKKHYKFYIAVRFVFESIGDKHESHSLQPLEPIE
jgi:hypothetical protein